MGVLSWVGASVGVGWPRTERGSATNNAICSLQGVAVHGHPDPGTTGFDVSLCLPPDDFLKKNLKELH
jgi:hypothetical protein